MSMRRSELAEIVRRDPRYAYEAYEFIRSALNHTQRMLGLAPERGKHRKEVEPKHISGRQLLDGIRDLALREFGFMARIVFRCWGIHKTDDFGEIVFNLVESNLMSKSPDDSRDDFRNVYDLDDALLRHFEIKLDETE